MAAPFTVRLSGRRAPPHALASETPKAMSAKSRSHVATADSSPRGLAAAQTAYSATLPRWSRPFIPAVGRLDFLSLPEDRPPWLEGPQGVRGGEGRERSAA